MIVRGAAAITLAVLGLAREPGCGGVDAPHGGTNAPCTRSSDCGGELVCAAGVCRDPDADGERTDAGADGLPGDPDAAPDSG